MSSAISNLSSNGTVYPVNIPTGTSAVNRYNVNLPVASPAGTIAFGILGSDYPRRPGAVGRADREPAPWWPHRA